MTFLLALLAAGWAQAAQLQERTLGNGRYVVQVTTGAKPAIGIMVFHGAVYEEGMRRGIPEFYAPFFESYSRGRALVVVYPLGRQGSCPWDVKLYCWTTKEPAKDAPFIRSVVTRMTSETGIKDWTALGISNGGYYLSSVILSGETLPFPRVINFIGGKAWYGPQNIQWTPDLTIVVGKHDEGNRPQGLELYNDLKASGYEKKAKLRLIEFEGGHEIPLPLLTEVLDGK